ncbi:MAG: diaminopimelate epimerase [Candidatus Omnitrophota bacterium]
MKNKYTGNFTKAAASGNDFVIIDNRDGRLDQDKLDYSEIAGDLCRRRHSVGADGLLVLEASKKGDFRMRIINPDGSEVDMCGNGARCSALYAAESGWGNDLVFETGAGILEAKVVSGNVKIKMSDPKDIQMDINLGIGASVLKVHYLNTGVPHVVHIVNDLDGYDVRGIGRQIREHSLFAPAGTNADFVGDIIGGKASIRTYERGVEDETLACGTGTVASAVVLGILEYAASPVKMKTRSGDVLAVHFDISGDKVTNVYLEGTASLVYSGTIQ